MDTTSWRFVKSWPSLSGLLAWGLLNLGDSELSFRGQNGLSLNECYRWRYQRISVYVSATNYGLSRRPMYKAGPSFCITGGLSPRYMVDPGVLKRHLTLRPVYDTRLDRYTENESSRQHSQRLIANRFESFHSNASFYIQAEPTVGVFSPSRPCCRLPPPCSLDRPQD